LEKAMKTLDLNKPVTANQLNENMFKKFGVKVNFDKYTREELENYRNLLRTKIFQVEQSTGFNASLTDDTYQKDKYMVNLLNTKIKEMLGESKKAKPDFLDMDKDGNKKEPMKKAVKDKKMKEGLKGNQGKLDVDKDGKLEKSDFAKLRAKKKVKESKESAAELAHHHAMEYMKRHRMGDLDHCSHHKKACEELGGSIHHGSAGECYHTHGGIMNGMAYLVKEGGMAAPAAPMGAPMGGAPAPAVGGMESQGMGMGTPEQGVAHNPVLGGQQTVGENMKQGDTKKSSTGGTITKTATGLKHTSGKNYSAMNPPPEDKKLEKKKSKVKENQQKAQIARLQYLREDEEEKAKTITAGSDMVNDFTTWMTRVGQYQTKSMIELADQIRQEFGQMESEAFKQAVAPALEQALQALSQTRETISSAVATLATGGTPNPMGGDMGGMDAGMDSGAMPPPAPTGDEFAAADAAAGGSELAGRETREHRQLFARKLSEAHSLVRSLSKSK
jgi:hypothetical protein